ncbi:MULTISPECIES: MATE family efflux transporter [unclassified Clostridium]|uniref:MATE family efflux transporter n=1 Tax=unclassified Clostridium TaxID=2614128 RepID=UPI0025BD457F|nr:MATE family efflux transporter [Clostridium sp.]MCI6691760.1 MATE family efflux transporter [Clostridium sp.]MDY2632693.1 MATE family efflux transporter [Clostridium sp.]MDY4251323.1 MATE family efflux transporter [Clostridium sp.]MDY6227135.1 MATE family efflux transporter [Clostridium sp.]
MKSLKDNILKDFTKYVSLNVISMIGLSFYILADTFFIANGVGSIGLTALNLVLPLWSLMSGFGLMIGIGAGISYSIKRGKNSEKGANKVFTHAMLMGVSIGAIITIIGVIFSYDIVVILGADELVAPLASKYLKTLLSFSCIFIVNSIITAFVRNDNNPKLAMIAMTIGSLSNVILDYIFIYPFKLGMFGAALATGATPILSLLILSLHFIKKKNNFKLIKCKINFAYMKRIISLGVPSFITEVSSGLIILLFNFTILKISNNTGVAAYGIIANLALIVISIFTGIAQGIQPIISKSYGEGKIKNIRTIFKYGIITAIILGVGCYLFGLIFSEEIVNLFNSEGDKVLLSMAIGGINIYFSAFIFMGINIVTTSFFASINKPKESFAISMIRGLIIVIPLILLLPNFLGMTGVWLTIPLSEAITLFISIIIYFKYKREIVNS